MFFRGTNTFFVTKLAFADFFVVIISHFNFFEYKFSTHKQVFSTRLTKKDKTAITTRPKSNKRYRTSNHRIMFAQGSFRNETMISSRKFCTHKSSVYIMNQHELTWISIDQTAVPCLAVLGIHANIFLFIPKVPHILTQKGEQTGEMDEGIGRENYAHDTHTKCFFVIEFIKRSNYFKTWFLIWGHMMSIVTMMAIMTMMTTMIAMMAAMIAMMAMTTATSAHFL